MKVAQEIPFSSDWPAMDAKFLHPEIPPAPELPIDDVFGPRFATWAREAADAKGAHVDYVVLSVVSVLSSVIGNARWVSPWNGWTEPPMIWAMLFGLPSAGKSPAIDAALQPLRYVRLYNGQLPRSILNGRTPIDALKDWQRQKPDLFRKRPYNHTGCDTRPDPR
jgi:hypothetical protein